MRKLLRAGLTAATICLAALAAPAFAICPNPNPNPAQRTASDFDGDCKSDILWRNTSTGENYLFFMNGPAVASEGSLRTVAEYWTLAGIGDFDGDGKADILWRNTSTGENYAFFMNGPAVASEGSLRTVAVDWTLAGIGDFNGDGKADILWRNTSTGENYVFFMNGPAVASEGSLRTVADLNWKVQPALSDTLPDLVVTSISYSSATGTFTSTVKNQGAAATPAGVPIGVAYSVDGVNRTWGASFNSLAVGASVTIGNDGGTYAIPAGTHTITAFVDDVN